MTAPVAAGAAIAPRSGARPMPRRPLAAVLRFHLRVGARVAAAAMVVPAAVAAGALMLLKPEEIADLAAMLFGPRAGIYPALVSLGLAVGVARFAAPRVCTGAGGWLAHLPVAGVSHRRAAALAVAVATLPLLLGLAALAAVPLFTKVSRLGQTLPRWLALPIAGLAAALAVLPLGHGLRARAAALAALAAGLLAALGRWPMLAAAVALLVLADLAAGRSRLRAAPIAGRRDAAMPAVGAPDAPLPALERRDLAAPADEAPGLAARLGLAGDLAVAGAAAAGTATPRSWLPLASQSWIPLAPRIAWRALRWRCATSCLAAAPPLAAAAFFLHNNRLPPDLALRGALLGGALSSVALLATLAGGLARRRPAWPWERSLPRPAARRVLDDALLLGLGCVPPVAATALLFPVAAVPLAAAAPLLAAAGAAALRRPPAGRLDAAGELMVEGLLLAALLALVPWSGAAMLAAAPLALRAAARRERRRKVSLWLERHHLAAGDPLSWSGG